MPKFIKRQIVVEAMQFDGKTFPEGVKPVYRDPMGERHVLTQDDIKPIGRMILDVDFTAEIETLEGPLRVSVGDWIITGVKGEKYPCKPDIFKETYQQEGNDFQYQYQQRRIMDAYLKGKQDAIDEYQTRYQELIYAVETKHPNETRHQTALRYIQEKEHGNQDTSSSCLTSKMIDTMKDFLKDEKVIVVDLKK